MRTSFALARRFPPFVLNGLALPSIAVIGRIGVLLTILTLTGSWVSAATEIRLAGNAALSPDGTQLAFSWRGDIWTVPTAGGTAQPLTMDEAQDSQPEFSPDGTQVAFVSDRTGSDQLFIMPAAGGSPQQVTFHTEGYSLLEWYPDGQSLLTMATRDNFWKHAERFFRVSTKPRSGESLVFDAYGRDGTLSPDGQRMLFTREGTRWWRKGYQGSQASQIWLYDLKKNKFQQVVSHPSGCRSPLWDPSGTAMYYVSGESGAMNLWRRDLDTGEQTQLTEFPDDSVLFPRISRDGKTIVFRHLFDFYVLHPDDGKPAQRIEICYEGDESRDELLRRTLASATDVAFSKDGLEVAFIAGGDVWVMDTELREPKQVTDSAEEERNLLFAPDGSALIFASDQGGQCDIWRATRENEDAYWWQNDQFQLKRLTNDTTVEEGLSWSPAGDMIGFIKSTGDLWVMKPDGDDARKILTSWNAPDYDWSPDGKWLVYAVSDADFNRDVFVLPVDGSREPFNLSLHPDNDRSPVWSPDGTMIAFTGRRYGDEVDICYVQLRTDKSEETSRDRKLKAALEKMKKMRRAKPSSGGDTPTSSRAKPGDFRGMDMDRNLRPPTLSGGLLDEELQQDPPAQDPPAQDPPAQDPPAQDPPAQAQDPPAQDPPNRTGSSNRILRNRRNRILHRILQNRILQNRILQNRILQNRILQNRILQSRILQSRILQNRILQNRILQNRILQNRILRNRILRNRSLRNRSPRNRIPNPRMPRRKLDRKKRKMKTRRSELTLRGSMIASRVFRFQIRQNRICSGRTIPSVLLSRLKSMDVAAHTPSRWLPNPVSNRSYSPRTRGRTQLGSPRETRFSG
jgi:Tol biopolymer transport system component